MYICHPLNPSISPIHLSGRTWGWVWRFGRRLAFGRRYLVFGRRGDGAFHSHQRTWRRNRQDPRWRSSRRVRSASDTHQLNIVLFLGYYCMNATFAFHLIELFIEVFNHLLLIFLFLLLLSPHAFSLRRCSTTEPWTFNEGANVNDCRGSGLYLPCVFSWYFSSIWKKITFLVYLKLLVDFHEGLLSYA